MKSVWTNRFRQCVDHLERPDDKEQMGNTFRGKTRRTSTINHLNDHELPRSIRHRRHGLGGQTSNAAKIGEPSTNNHLNDHALLRDAM